MITELYTDKLKLSAPKKSDATNLFYLRTNPIVNRFIKRKLPQNITDTELFIEQRNADNTNYFFTIKTLENSKLVGTICLKNIDRLGKYAEVGYELLPDFQKKRIMSDALHRIINFAFTDLELETIEAFTHKENFASRTLLEKFNFKLIKGKTDPNNPNNIIYRLKKH